MVLQISHDESGHLGIRKAYDRILAYFFLAQTKERGICLRKVMPCQLNSKLNQSLKPVMLCPNPAIGQPFEHLIIDCVGPLPPSKGSASYLLTVMCQSTGYSAAFPLRTIIAGSVVRFFFFSLVFLGSFSLIRAHLFAQVLKQLLIKNTIKHLLTMPRAKVAWRVFIKLLSPCCVQIVYR